MNKTMNKTKPINVNIYLKELKDHISQGNNVNYILFWGHYSEPGVVNYSCLSQFYSAPFIINGVPYQTAEQWMMANKAKTFGDEAALARIMATDSPAEAKAIGRKVRGYDNKTWSAIRFDIVVQGNVAKFSQNCKLRDYLLDTNEDILVEASPYDKIWGIGLDRSHKHAKDPFNWRGQNLLGFAIMEARKKIREKSE